MENRSGCVVSKYLWPAADSTRTGWLLGLYKASLRLVVGYITGHCEIRSLTGIWKRSQPDYCRVCCDEELENVKRGSLKFKLTCRATSMHFWPHSQRNFVRVRSRSSIVDGIDDYIVNYKFSSLESDSQNQEFIGNSMMVQSEIRYSDLAAL